ncbi:hypothetical protein R5R35_004416 [Gryllus longicercus]|uniref:Odorant binding protein n=1 Tax=Gryllus longicercus TaxID=2509291 RepID=A0AAN9VBC4_9ORTH
MAQPAAATGDRGRGSKHRRWRERRRVSAAAAVAAAALVVLTCAAVLTGTGAQARRVPMWQRTVRSKAAECKNITNASDRDVAAVKSYYRHLSENAKCLLKCVYEQLGIIRDNHFIDQKEGLQLFHQYFAHDKMTLKLGMLVVGKCLARGRSASNPCQGAYQARICFLAFRL